MGTSAKIEIGLIGRGAIGGAVESSLAGNAIQGVVLKSGLTRRTPPDGASDIWTNDIDRFLASQPDIVVESGGPDAFVSLVPQILAKGIDTIAVSLAAMAKPEVEAEIRAAMAASGAQLFAASGAIGALDALSAAREGGLTAVELVQRKPHHAFPDADLTAGTTRIISSGSARDAAIAFPKNSNIAAAVALAGIGFDATRVTVVADHEITVNQAELTAKGDFGQFTMTIRNRPSSVNPRTATLTAQSVLAAIRRRSGAGIVIPA